MQGLKAANMVREIASKFPLEAKVQNALLSVNRELFVPNGCIPHAYSLDALPMGANQWISSPLTVAKMTQYLNLEGVDSVLEIGCGSGYQAAILATMVRRVFSVERIERLLNEARMRFRQCGFSNIHTKLDDGTLGWSAYAPYDRILFSASIGQIPQEIIKQLDEGGIIIAPIKKESCQIITRFVKKNGVLILQDEIETCSFVPILSGIE
ncbi:protein-L-isoaspartate O-methyltransferase [Helicobacter valdiviensis]|uniref:Protein-L-isoaspartate O-methyltransferase n=1 Tax=Helicobacter valdiviensis TaxID=1458358 RepID=A0A2W6NMY3_9HELI|nr:protein-L-isoaspartate(D-aspartate) O-methyltransferase [Helicobacter valdiviensis]PZT48806.1 protein-L-isoaspartate O-methyltransferase [Helicobacter valdiviensis]